MLSAYVNASDMEGAEKFFRRLKQDGFQPNVVTYGTLIKGYAKINNLQKMMEKYEEMQVVHGIKANQAIYTAIMDAYGRNRDFGSAVFWFKEMGVCGAPPDRKAQNILLSLAKTEAEKEEASLLVGNRGQYINGPVGIGSTKYPDEDDEENNSEDDSDEVE